MNTRTLYIVDDNSDFLEATSFWLSSAELEVCSWADPLQAVEAIARRDLRRPACLMLDIRMPGMSGLELHDALIRRDADLPVIYMSGHADVALAVRAMQKGAVTLLEKPFDEAMLEDSLKQAFSAAAHGLLQPPATPRQPQEIQGSLGLPGSPEATAGSPSTRAGSDRPGYDRAEAVDSEARSRFAARRAKLSPRERQVIEFVIQGVYNKNIADRIGLSIKTVELYRARGMAKMQARSVAELTRMMITAQAD
jgi:two-component system, LuxR family, response regulator FixJ